MEPKKTTTTALARTEKKLEVDDHLWDDDDEEVVIPRRSRGSRTTKKAVAEPVKEEPKVVTEEAKKPEVEKTEEADTKEPEKQSSPAVVVEDKKKITTTALARTEKKLEVDDHLWDDDEDEKAAPRRVRGRRGERKVVFQIVEKEGRPNDDWDDDDDKPAKPRRVRGSRRAVKLESFEASWGDEVSTPRPEETTASSPVKTETPIAPAQEEAAPSVEAPKSNPSDDDWGSDHWDDAENSVLSDKESPSEAAPEIPQPVTVSPEVKSEEPAKETVEETKVSEAESVKEEPKMESVKKSEAEVKSEEIAKEEPEEEVKPEEPVKETEEEVKSAEPAKEEAKPVKESVKPMKSDAKLVKEETTPIKEETKPVKEEAKPTKNDTKPAKESDSKPADKTTPAPPKTIYHQTTPALTESSRLAWEMVQVADLALNCVPDYTKTVAAIRSCLKLFPDRSDIAAFFTSRLLVILAEKSLRDEELASLSSLLCECTQTNPCLRRCASDFVAEKLVALASSSMQQQKQLLATLASFYENAQDDFVVDSLVDVLLAAFAVESPSIAFLSFYLVHAVEILPKLSLPHVRLVLSVCGLNMVCQVASLSSCFDKDALMAMVQMVALLYGKTDNKSRIVDLTVRLLALALRRSYVLQPANTPKAKEDACLVRVNAMIGELLFLMARVNTEELKTAIGTLPAETTALLQNQLKKTIQLKQVETNAARRRNATRMPVKLDASKFESCVC